MYPSASGVTIYGISFHFATVPHEHTRPQDTYAYAYSRLGGAHAHHGEEPAARRARSECGTLSCMPVRGASLRSHHESRSDEAYRRFISGAMLGIVGRTSADHTLLFPGLPGHSIKR